MVSRPVKSVLVESPTSEDSTMSITIARFEPRITTWYPSHAKDLGILFRLSELVQTGRPKSLIECIDFALDEGIDPWRIIDEGLFEGMRRLNTRFIENEIFVPELMYAAKAVGVGMNRLRREFPTEELGVRGKVVLATVEFDQHDIGKNLVRYMMEAKGLDVIDLGVDVPASRVVEAVREHEPSVVALSCFMTTMLKELVEVVQELKKASLHTNTKVMVGGASVTREFSESLGADGFSEDAFGAALVAAELVSLHR